MWNTSCSLLVSFLSWAWAFGGGTICEAGDVAEFRILNGTPYEARAILDVPGGGQQVVWLERGATVLRLRPEVDFTGSLNVQYNSEVSGSYWTNGNVWNGQIGVGGGEGVGVIEVVIPDQGVFPGDVIYWAEGKPLREAWVSGMAIGGIAVSMAIVFRTVRAGRGAISRS